MSACITEPRGPMVAIPVHPPTASPFRPRQDWRPAAGGEGPPGGGGRRRAGRGRVEKRLPGTAVVGSGVRPGHIAGGQAAERL